MNNRCKVEEIVFWFLISRHFERNSLIFGQILGLEGNQGAIKTKLGEIWKYFKLETWNFGLKSADSASLRNSSSTIDLLRRAGKFGCEENKSTFHGCCQIGGFNRLWKKSLILWLLSNWWLQQTLEEKSTPEVVVKLVASTDFGRKVYSWGCCQIGGFNRL